MDLEQLQAFGLYDPAAPDAAERRALLAFLIERGATLEKLAAADRQGRLPGVAADLIIQPPGKGLTREEVAQRAGLPVEIIARLQRASGFPDPEPGSAPFGELDVQTFRVAAASMAFFGEEVTIQFTRVMGSAAARIAEAAISIFENKLADRRSAAELDELTVARANADAASLVPGIAQVLDGLLRRHFEATINRLLAARGETRAAGTAQLAIGFADMAGFTALSQQLPTRELSRLVTDFDALTSEVVTRHGGRLVKLIGDEAMFITPSVPDACRIALELPAALSRHPRLPSVRQGLAAGDVLTKDGDFYGTPVNLASRVARLAEPGTILVSAAVREQAEAAGGFDFVARDAQTVKGFQEPVQVWALVAKSTA